MGKQAYLLGIDVGTSGVKVLLIDELGTTIQAETEEYPLSTPHPHWIEQDPEDWWQATITCIKKIVSSQERAENIKAVGFSGQMHSSVFLDKDGKVLCPAILWCDTRTTAQCEQITKIVGIEGLRELVSNPALEGFTAPKILWLREHMPEIYEKVAKVLLPKDYIRFRLSGTYAAEVSDAAGTLLYDVKNRRWSTEILEKLDISSDFLPRVHESVDVCATVSKQGTELTGLKEGTPLVGGGADNTCGAVGTGIVVAGRVLVSLGTSGVVFAHTDSVCVDPQMRVHTFCHSVPHKWYLMGVMLSAGNSLKWWRDTFGENEKAIEQVSGIDAYTILDREAEKSPAGSEGLLFLPYLTGERTPHKDANAKGTFFGITLRHNRTHFIRSIMEGITFGLKDSLEIMKEQNIPLEEVRLTGGGAKSAFWQQLQADIFGVEVATVANTEGPALGAALMAGVGAKLYSSLEEACEKVILRAGITEPRKEISEQYQAIYDRFKALYPALKDQFVR